MKTLRAIFSLDGAQDETTVFMDYGLGDICKTHSIEYLKLAASCCGAQQPNDVATCHKDLKTANAKIKYDAERPPHVSPVTLTVVKHCSQLMVSLVPLSRPSVYSSTMPQF
jgi:hypothetical protein